MGPFFFFYQGPLDRACRIGSDRFCGIDCVVNAHKRNLIGLYSEEMEAAVDVRLRSPLSAASRLQTVVTGSGAIVLTLRLVPWGI